MCIRDRLQAELQQLAAANPSDIFTSGANILLSGLGGGDLATIASSYAQDSSTMNDNPINPSPAVYPKASPSDAPYSLTEQQLRQVIYIPPGFTYGKLPPVLFLEGTASVSGQTFGPNFGKLLAAHKVADPVYVNIPGMNLADIQVAAEYAAYAVNYISGISNGTNVTTLSWSAGSLDGQWACLLYTSPSPRDRTRSRMPSSA